MNFGKFELKDCLGKLVAGADEILNIQLAVYPTSNALRLVAVVQNLVDQDLPFIDALLMDQRCSKQVGNRLVIRILLLRGLEDPDHILVAPHARVTICQQKDRLVILRVF